MKNEELFERTVSRLVEAYEEGKLKHSSSCACAVGNLVNYKCAPNLESTSWWVAMRAHITNNKSYCSQIKILEGQLQVANTGYTMDEIVLIEHAFENYPGRPEENEEAPIASMDALRAADPKGLKGLRNVYDVLCKIHEVDLQTVATAEEVFV